MTWPDWRNKDEYPRPEDLTYSAWAWEFLRRNQEYQNGYARLRILWNEKPIAPGNNNAPLGNPGAAEAFLEIRNRWGLKTDCDPSLSAAEMHHDKTAAPVDFIWWSKDLRRHDPAALNPNPKTAGAYLEKLPEGVRFFSINLNQPLKRQFAAIEKLAKVIQDHSQIEVIKAGTKAHREKYQGYLRALDADTAGVLQKEIAATIDPDSWGRKPLSAARKISDQLRSAGRLRDGDYKKIIALD